MADRPIIFSGPMVRALLDGRKTQTRRVINPQPALDFIEAKFGGDGLTFRPAALFGSQTHKTLRRLHRPGDRLWVRETCRGEEVSNGLDGVRFSADETFIPIANTNRAAIDWLKLHTYRGHTGAPIGPWVPSIHVPRWTSRLTLTVTDVRVQRLQEISDADAVAEGVDLERYIPVSDSAGLHSCGEAEATDPVDEYRTLWDSLNADRGYGWEANPWVAAYTFTVERRNIDEQEGR